MLNVVRLAPGSRHFAERCDRVDVTQLFASGVCVRGDPGPVRHDDKVDLSGYRSRTSSIWNEKGPGSSTVK